MCRFQRSADCCYRCERKIDQTDCVHAFGRCYHTDCFKCNLCKRQLNIWRSRLENKQPVCDPVCPTKTDSTGMFL
ncbi:hypothetical protein PHET_04124 [Paragonimus heterotremus]|uniref:LIM zinc-binding domain-containing protein n=1 Tax=Paragonimus heterotremus TaxID=100268 RepID=A0A8J4WS91_9TREM|nr:hypothetical protein PHET_04124 [Paragonimus heterotremus]